MRNWKFIFSNIFKPKLGLNKKTHRWEKVAFFLLLFQSFEKGKEEKRKVERAGCQTCWKNIDELEEVFNHQFDFFTAHWAFLFTFLQSLRTPNATYLMTSSSMHNTCISRLRQANYTQVRCKGWCRVFSIKALLYSLFSICSIWCLLWSMRQSLNVPLCCRRWTGNKWIRVR